MSPLTQLIHHQVSFQEQEEEEREGKSCEVYENRAEEGGTLPGVTTEPSAYSPSLTRRPNEGKPFIVGWAYPPHYLIPPTILHIPQQFAAFSVNSTTKALCRHERRRATSIGLQTVATTKESSKRKEWLVKGSPSPQGLVGQVSDITVSPIRKKKILSVVSTDEEHSIPSSPQQDGPLIRSQTLSLASSGTHGESIGLPSLERKVGRWTKEEDATLVDAVASQRPHDRINWKEISTRCYHGNRNAAQCKARWNKVCVPPLRMKSMCEDEPILTDSLSYLHRPSVLLSNVDRSLPKKMKYLYWPVARVCGTVISRAFVFPVAPPIKCASAIKTFSTRIEKH